MTATGVRPDGRVPGPRGGDGVPTSSTAPEDQGRLDAGEALPRLVRIAGEVIAPATLLTALLFQFGRLHAAGYYRHFGVNFTVLDLTVQDHLVSGADGLFVPLAGACVLVLLLLSLNRVLLVRLPPAARARSLALLPPVAGVAGALLLGLALLDLLTGVRPLWGEGEAGGLARLAAPAVRGRGARGVGCGVPGGQRGPLLGGGASTRSAWARAGPSSWSARCPTSPPPCCSASEA